MRRSTGGAPGRALRRALTCLLPLLAASILASPAQAGVRPQAGVRAQAASTQAIAGVLSEATGLAPSQVTSEAACGPARPGFAQCDAQALVLSSNHARVRPHVHGGSTFTQVFPRAAPPFRRCGPPVPGQRRPSPSTPAWLAAGVRPDVPLPDGRGRRYGGGRRRRRRPDRRVRSGRVPRHIWTAGLFVLRAAASRRSMSPERRRHCRRRTRLGARGVARPRRGLGALPELPHPARRGLDRQHRRPRQRRDRGGAPARQPDIEQLERSLWDADRRPVHLPGVAVIAATGDEGYMGGGSDAYPAAFPGVTAAGGTSLAAATNGQSARGFSESAWSLFDGWGATSGCNPNEPKPAYQLDSRLHRARVFGSLRRRRPGHGADDLRRRGLVAVRRDQPRHPADRRVRGNHRRERRDPAVGLHRQRRAERPHRRLERQLPGEHRLHLRRRSRL